MDLQLSFCFPSVSLHPSAGNTCWCAVIGSYTYWGPKAGKEVFNLSQSAADVSFGAVTVLTGVVGTILGGVAMDRVGSSMVNAQIIPAAAITAALAILLLAFGAVKSFGLFMLLFAVAELGLFAIQARAGPFRAACAPEGPRWRARAGFPTRRPRARPCSSGRSRPSCARSAAASPR